MDKQQFSNLIMSIKSSYPALKVIEDSASAAFWYTMLKDIPYDVAENAVMEHICVSDYPPSIARIRSLCMDRFVKQEKSPEEAWETVRSAITRYGSANPQKALESFDDITAGIVKSIGWTKLCQSQRPDQDMAVFQNAYREKVSDLREQKVLPKFVQRNKQMLQEKYTGIMGIQNDSKIVDDTDTDTTDNEITEEQMQKVRMLVHESENTKSVHLTEEQVRERHERLEDLKKNILRV